MADLKTISSVLTNDYLSKKLSAWFKKDVLCTKHEVTELSGKGDSYLGDLYKIRIYGKILSNDRTDSEVSIRVFLKSFPKNIGRRKTYRCSDFFRTEIKFYKKVIPVLLKFQSEKSVTEPFQNCPRLFAAASNDIDDFVALEDLNELGYKCAVRQQSIDYVHILNILDKFAKFHALSFAFKDQHPEMYEELAESVPETYFATKFWGWYKDFWKSLCICAIDAIEKELPDSIYVEKIKAFATDKTYERIVEATHAKTKSCVIGHGDTWTPNFLFKYKENSNVPIDSMIIDFQLARSAPAVLDVASFIYAVSSIETLNEHYHDMLKYYYDILARQIRELGSNSEQLYSWDTFMEEVIKYSYFGVGFGLESAPASIIETEEAPDLNSISGTEAINMAQIMNVKPIKTKAGRQRLAGMVKHAVDNGYI